MDNDNFNKTYQKELILLKELMSEFYKRHPKIAARLRLDHHGSSDDAAMIKLLGTTALLFTKARFHLDDEFSQISDYLLEYLHPHALAPIPSMAIVQLDFHAKKLISPHWIPANSPLFTDTIHGHKCTFKTCYPINLLPLCIEQAVLMEQPLQVPTLPNLAKTNSVLKLQINTTHNKLSIADLNIESLRFFIQAEPKAAYEFYDLLFNQTIEIALANSNHDKNPIVLEKSCLTQVGFEATEGMLPYGEGTRIGYRLITEFFAFPEKFLFFDIKNIQDFIGKKFSEPNVPLEFYFYFKKTSAYLKKIINVHFLRLHCAPIVNLFESSCDTVLFNKMQNYYLLQPTSTTDLSTTEIYSITNVTATMDNQESQEILPFHDLPQKEKAIYYHVDRKPAWYFGHYPIPGSATQLRFTDLYQTAAPLENWNIAVNTLCTNRNLPLQLAAQNSVSHLTSKAKIDVIKDIVCIKPFTAAYHPFLQKNYKWLYISHLSLNYLWSTFIEEGEPLFYALLGLYQFKPEQKNLLYEGILAIQAKNAFLVKHNKTTGGFLWHGTEISLTINERKFELIGIYLFANILERFFAMFTTKNLYTQLIVRNQHTLLYKFPPRSGEKATI